MPLGASPRGVPKGVALGLVSKGLQGAFQKVSGDLRDASGGLRESLRTGFWRLLGDTLALPGGVRQGVQNAIRRVGTRWKGDEETWDVGRQATNVVGRVLKGGFGDEENKMLLCSLRLAGVGFCI